MPNASETEGNDEELPSTLTFYAQTHAQPAGAAVFGQLPRELCEHCGTPIAVLTIKLPAGTIRRSVEVVERSDGTVTFQSHDHDPAEDPVEQSSLGTPGAQQLRARIAPERARWIVDRAQQSSQIHKITVEQLVWDRPPQYGFRVREPSGIWSARCTCGWGIPERYDRDEAMRRAQEHAPQVEQWRVNG